MSLTAARETVISDKNLRGGAFCAALSAGVDGFLLELYRESVGEREGISLVAVGGYGRGELCPHSDLDVVLVHDGVADIADVASKLWYPLWDEGAKLGHSVRTIDEAIELASGDLDTATSLLTSRRIAGDATLAERLAADAAALWRRQGRAWLSAIDEAVVGRHRTSGEVAFMLEPDLKNGRGGMRDVQSLHWAFLTSDPESSFADTGLADHYEELLGVRVELHREAARPGDRLLLQTQDAVAAALEYPDADELMAQVASSARRIAWHSDEVWVQLLDGARRKRPRLRRSPTVDAGPGVTVVDGRVHIDDDAEITAEVVLSAAIAVARHEARLAPSAIERLEQVTVVVPDPWPDELRALFVDLLLVGHDAIPVIETLDQLGLFVAFIPEWAPNQSRPQRNRYHRFTIDRHLWEAAAEAAELAEKVERPDLLVVGALLHDIGKGYDGDHTVVGMAMIPTIAARMGFSDDDSDVLVRMCEHHLLLPDVATRRDLHDDDTIDFVADAVRTVRVLRLLEALTVADSIATGPAAWSSWKAGLVADLANRVAYVLDGGSAGELPRNFPSDYDRDLMRRGTTFVKGEGGMLTVMVQDRPGVFSRVAGVMTLSGLDVLEAAAYTEFGIALAVFRVQNSFDATIDWDRVCGLVDDAVNGRLALAARIDDRVRTYAAKPKQRQPTRIVQPAVTVHNELSSAATVIEVSSRNGIGLLYYVTSALSQLDLDIATAKIQTLGDDVVDSFYVLDRTGAKVEDPNYRDEIVRAIDHALHLALSPARK